MTNFVNWKICATEMFSFSSRLKLKFNYTVQGAWLFVSMGLLVDSWNFGNLIQIKIGSC